MARPKKNTADYFPHLCNHGKKMAYVERRHGNDGYATWYKILEKLAQANDHYLHIEDEIEADFLADYCMVDIEKLTEILSDLVKVGALSSEAWENKIVYSCTLIESLTDLYARRKDKPRGLMQIIQDVGGVSVDINPHSIGEESKVENSIEEKSRVDTSLPAKPTSVALKHSDEDIDLARTWGKSVTERSPSFKLTAEHGPKWANVIRLMRERDGRSIDEIAKFMDGVHKDPFWSENIFDVKKLREQVNKGALDKLVKTESNNDSLIAQMAKEIEDGI